MDDDALRGALKRIPSREKIDQLYRMSQDELLDVGLGSDDREFLSDIADLLLDLRQAARGGRRDIRGSRHWDLGQ